MKVYAWNVNGLRAVHNKGALESFIKKENPDIILFQEIKAREEQLHETLTDDTFIRFYNSAEKAGYSGVAIWVHPRNKKIFKSFSKGMPKWEDNEGRVAQCFLTNNTVIISVYVPNGGKSEEAYKEKLSFFKLLTTYVKALQKEGNKVIIGGDFNVAHNEIDLAEPEKHRNHTHFNDEIRACIGTLIDAGLTDSYRIRNPDKKGAYSYWDNFSFSLPRGTKPRDVNSGWRLDYMLVDSETNDHIKEAQIHQNILGSDHCPVSIWL